MYSISIFYFTFGGVRTRTPLPAGLSSDVGYDFSLDGGYDLSPRGARTPSPPLTTALSLLCRELK